MPSSCATLLCLLALLLPASRTAAKTAESLPCLYTRSETVLIFECRPLQAAPTAANSAELPSQTRIERQLDQLVVPNTTIRLANVTRVRPDPPPQLDDLPVEIKRCGLAKLGRLLNETAGCGGLMLNFSGLSLRLGGHGDFDGLSASLPTWLDLSHNRIDSLPPGVFDSLPNLVALNLAWNSIEHLDEDAFCSAPAATLRWLDLRGNPMLKTFSLPSLRALEWLDASLTVLHVGSFCRMASLSRVTLHWPVTLLQCFVFDSLPNLSELSLSYYKGAKNVCMTMMCDPHPALNGSRVPFNFSIALVNSSDGSVLKVSKNLFIRKQLMTAIYKPVCETNYVYYKSFHDRGIPATHGCGTPETDSPICSKTIPPASVCLEPTTSTATTTTATLSTTPVPDDDNTLNMDSTSALLGSVAVQEVSETLPPTFATTARRAVAYFDDSPGIQQAKSVHEALRRQKNRYKELEEEIARLDKFIIAVYSVNAVLIFILASLAVRCSVVRCRRSRQRRSSFWHQHGQHLLGPEQHPLQLTSTAHADTAAAAAISVTPAVQTTTAIFLANVEDKTTAGSSGPHDANNDHVPMPDAMYPRLPGDFPNPTYGTP